MRSKYGQRRGPSVFGFLSVPEELRIFESDFYSRFSYYIDINFMYMISITV